MRGSVSEKYGLILPNDGEALFFARRAEALGFGRIGVGEHLFFHGPTSNAFISLAAAAAATSSVRLLSAVTLLPLYPPALAAKLAASLDVVSEGRFDFGVGVGGEHPPEFEAAGVPVSERGARADESLEIIRRLFTGDGVEFNGGHAALRGVRLDPPPVRAGGPPIWVAGRKEAALRRTARFGDVWMPYMVTPGHVAAGLDRIRELTLDTGVNRDVRASLFAWICVDDGSGWAERTGVEYVSRMYRQDFSELADKYLLLGTPERVAERIAQYQSAGVESVMFAIAAPPERQEKVLETIADHFVGGTSP